MKYYIIAGEASGDLHASNLMRELKALDAGAHFRAWGGDLMQAQGAELVKHYRELAFMGFKEVIVNLRTIFRNIAFCKEDINAWKPDVLIFVDYPGFNMRIAEWAHQAGYKTVYYISPQIWAWKEGRAKKLKRDIDKMIVILPFEQEFYKKYGFEVQYVGHPLLDVIGRYQPDAAFLENNQLAGRRIIALLPGSRVQEIAKKLPLMLSVKSQFPGYTFVIAGAPGMDPEYYKMFTGGDKNTAIVFNKTYDLLSHAEAALVTSGTATLETALLGIPEVVCYLGSKFSYEIGKRLVKVKYISLVNLIMDKMIVKELIQYELTTENLGAELHRLLDDTAYRIAMIENYKLLKQKLGGAGASMRAAAEVWDFVKNA
jgi:lipid-A-disaccharide synthase